MDLLDWRAPTSEGADGEPLAALVRAFQTAFPGRIAGVYLHGSQADDSAIGASDLDLDIVVRGQFRGEDERAALLALARGLSARTDLDLDIDITDEATLDLGAEPSFKLGSRLLYGEDIRSRVPLIPIEEWGRERMHRGYFLLMSVFNRSSPARLPLHFPDPGDEFYGYINRTVMVGGVEAPSTRNLVRVTGWLATALLAHEAGEYVVNKRECHLLYRRAIGDEWAPLLEEIYRCCRGNWNYAVPGDPAERAQLRELCRRTLAFENAFLARYRPFLIHELHGAREGRESRAPWLMERIPFDDPEVRAAMDGGDVQ